MAVDIEDRGELNSIENVDWNLKMGAIVDVLYREHPPYPPALIFDRIKDHKPGYRTLFGHFASPQRIALTLGIEEKFDHVLQFTRMYHERMKHCVPLHRIEVDSGPVQEVGARQARSVLSRLEHGCSKQLSLKQLT